MSMMIPADAVLFVYEINGDPGRDLPTAPQSLVGVWNEDELAYIFFTRSEDEYVNSLLVAKGLAVNSRHEVDYKDWQTGLPASGVIAGGVSFVAPNHLNPPPDAIILDPSVVFGDGTHPTTVSCLQSLKKITTSWNISSLLDLGTGTAVLALAGARMGIHCILAVDKNRLAVATARQNVNANALSEIIQIREGEARIFIDEPFDVVAANLPFHVLRELSALRGTSLHKFWIISGISKDQGNLLETLFGEQGYSKLDYHDDHPWVTFTMAHTISGRKT